jgi:hypothetical protein
MLQLILRPFDHPVPAGDFRMCPVIFPKPADNPLWGQHIQPIAVGEQLFLDKAAAVQRRLDGLSGKIGGCFLSFALRMGLDARVTGVAVQIDLEKVFWLLL